MTPVATVESLAGAGVATVRSDGPHPGRCFPCRLAGITDRDALCTWVGTAGGGTRAPAVPECGAHPSAEIAWVFANLGWMLNKVGGMESGLSPAMSIRHDASPHRRPGIAEAERWLHDHGMPGAWVDVAAGGRPYAHLPYADLMERTAFLDAPRTP